MDENRPAYRLSAPGAASSAGSYRLPGASSPLGVDDHVVEPESERREVMIEGRILYAQPAHAPHGMQNANLDYVLQAHLAPGYAVATDLLTRFDEANDFASDTAILREDEDPATGRRYLEELAFEVVSEQQSEKVVTTKAPIMLRRGVRRVFAVFLKKGELREWRPDQSAVRGGRWVLLDRDGSIADPVLATPVPVRALLDAAQRHDAVAAALIARDHPMLRRSREDARAEGRAEGLASAILAVLTKRGLDSAAARERLERCRDVPTLDRWLQRALVAASLAEVFAEP